MPLALIISSFVAASRIGGVAQQYVLAAHKIDPVLAPTVMFGRSPAKGAKGEVTSPEVLARILGDIEADALFGLVDLFLTGHFSLPEQVELAADVMARVRSANRDGAFAAKPIFLVDPVMGDEPKGLYVKPEVADALKNRLVPLADYITPNLWELQHLTGRSLTSLGAVVDAARSLGRPALVTSAPARPGETGLMYVDGRNSVLFAHPKVPNIPNGTGDLVAAAFGAALVEGLPPLEAAERAARAAAETTCAAEQWRAPELPIVALATRVANPTAPVRIEMVGVT